MDLDSLIDIILPGDSSVTEATILEWLKSPGEFVTEHEPILEVTTDKVTMEVAAPATGHLVEVVAPPETVVYPGTVLGRIERAKVAEVVEPVAPAPDEDFNADAVQGSNESARLSPLVRRMLREHKLSPESVRGTGRGGRITHRDILAHLEGGDVDDSDIEQSSPDDIDSPETEYANNGDGSSYFGDGYLINGEELNESSSVQEGELGQEQETDILFDGSTRDSDEWPDANEADESEWFNPPVESTSQTSVQDQEEGNLWGFLESDSDRIDSAEPSTSDSHDEDFSDSGLSLDALGSEATIDSPATPSPDDSSFAFESEVNERIPHSTMRRSIARHMVESVRTAPHVTSIFDADMSRVIAHREANKEEAERRGIRLTYTSYFVAAVAHAVKVVPQVNSVWHDDSLEVIRHANVGVATALDDDGLIVPVVQNADELDLLAIARRLQDLVSSARNGALSKSDVSGGTITITNHGVSGSLIATPIISQPQSAILGVGRLEKRVVVRQHNGRDSIEIAPMVYVTLTIDHRALDGHQANKFLSEFVAILENWE